MPHLCTTLNALRSCTLFIHHIGVKDLSPLCCCCRQPGPCSYELNSAWAYLQKHVPSVLLAAAHTIGQSSGSSSSSGEHHSQAMTAASLAEHAAEQTVLYDLSRALQQIRPRVPAWGFAPLPTVTAGFRQGSRGVLSGLELLYDVRVTLVKRRTPGECCQLERKLHLFRPVTGPYHVQNR